MKNFVSKRIAAFKEYKPGEQAKSIIKLNANENYYPPSPKVKAFLKQYPIQKLRLYPDPQALDLIETIKSVYELKESSKSSIGIVVGNGADEIIRGIFATFFEGKRDTVLLSDITYAGYAPYAQLYDIPIKILKVNEATNKRPFQIPLEKIAKSTAKVVFITNPNNPTGIYIPAKEIIYCVKQNPNKLFIIDEAYIDFNSNNKESCIHYLPLTNLFVLRTLSKSYCGAGLRLGFGIGDIHLTSSIRKVLDPYNLSILTLDIGKVILQDQTYLKKVVRDVALLRTWLEKELIKRGFEVLPSEANFIFCKPKQVINVDKNTAELLFQFLKIKKIYVRYFDTKKLNLYIRITIGTQKELITLLKEIDIFYQSKINR